MDDDMEMHFECYWEDMQRIAKKHGERVSDRDGWRDPFDEGQTAEQAFYAEYPEHKDGVNAGLGLR